jgi:P4 family phage/plasmid primase-like protien
MTSIKKYEDFMRAHSVPKDAPKETIKTNTRIPSKPGDKEHVYGGKYNIPDDKYPEFLALYYNYCIQDKNDEFLTEIQLEQNGPILVDMDLKYAHSVDKRLHTKDHVDDLVSLYLETLKLIYQFNETPFYIFVMEKDDINRINDSEKPLTKDGIHIIIGIKASRAAQMYLRTQILLKIGSMWGDLPIINRWEDVLDSSISSGNTGWQLYGSRKPDNQPYRLKYIYENTFDPADNEAMSESISLKSFNISQKIMYLSARYDGFPAYPMNTNISKLLDNNPESVQKKRIYVSSNNVYFSGSGVSEAIMHVKNHNELELVVQETLQQLNSRDYELVETHKYTMTLPEQYYGAGSYEKWLRVGMALSEICNLMFITWVAFSAQSKDFKFSQISEMYEKWQKFDKKGNGPILTRRSIMHWSKQDANAKFKAVRNESVDYYIDKTINPLMDDMNDGKKGNGKPCGDFDIANVLKQLYKDEYVCVSIKNNIWYKFHNHRWMEIDSGTTLRKSISTELRDIYHKKMASIDTTYTALQEQDQTNDNLQTLKKKMGKICDICIRLVTTNDKKNIMTEAKELFHDPLFMEKLDTNPYLLCFENGVVDFKEKIFRKGYPEDYVSKSTCIEYIPIDSTRDAKTVAEINDFMAKLFPRPQLRDYMWDHLASILVGTPDKQTFHMYIGEGRNGKSVLTTLIDEIMGEYKGVVPLSAITQDRSKIGGTAAELAELKGVRYAVIMEPSKKDAILEGPLKQLTSGLDPIQCRAPYSAKTMIYYPQFKLVLCSNVRMEVKTQDFGTWRRIREVPFESLFTENPVHDDPDKPFQFLVDGTIVDKFKYWKYTFMSMLVKQAFKTGGKVGECDIVVQASKAYQESQDFIAEFIREKIVIDPNGKIKKTELNSEFTVWYQSTYGKGAPSPKEVHTYMDKKFGKFEKKEKGAWTGAKIKYEREETMFKQTDDGEDVFDDGIGADDL